MSPRNSTTPGKTAKPAARTTAAKTTAATPRATPTTAKPRAKAKPRGSVSPKDRLRLIAEAAYYRAERRGFAGGCELDDWIAAEAEVDALLDSRGTG